MVLLPDHLISSETVPKNLTPLHVGGKAWNLFRLLGFGFSVPPWCVLTTSAFSKAVCDNRNAIKKILTSADFTDRASLDLAALQIGTTILDGDLTQAQELTAALKQSLGEDGLFAVRSSVVGEDSANHSFAGQMDSFLNVPLHQVPETIKKVWASAFSFRALAYRKRKELSLSEISTAVIIQKMVQSTAAGVLFTREHGSSTRECVIAAAFGLGEGVVADLVESDTYRIAWDSDKIAKAVASKDFRILLNAKSQTGTHKEPVPAALRSQPVLADTQIRLLRDIGVKAEQCFGTPQDVEWAFDRFGQVFVLQARPIVSGKHAAPPVGIWDNSNIVESYPGLTLPLTFSFARAAYETTFRNAALGFLLCKNELKRKPDIFNNLIGLLDGRVYYNLLNWYDMLSYLPGADSRKSSWDQMIGIAEPINFPQNQLTPLNKFYCLLVAAQKLLTLRRTANKFFDRFNSVYGRFQDADLSKATEYELVAIYQSLTDEVGERWHLTLDNDLCAMTYYEWLKKLCVLSGLADHANLHNDLLCGEAGVESVAPVSALARLVETVSNEPLYRSAFSDDDDQAIWQKICTERPLASLNEALAMYLKDFGDRGLEELKLELPSFRERPELLVRLIRQHLRFGSSGKTMDRDERAVRGRAEAFVREHLRNPLKRLLFRFVLAQARRAIVNRENMRFARTRFFGLLRSLFRRMGEIFAQTGLLESSDDIHYLTVDEVFGFVRGTSVTRNLKALAKLRQQEYAMFAERTPKERIRTIGLPYLSSFDANENHGEVKTQLKGTGCSSGVAEGTARVIFEPRAAPACGDHILVARSTDPGWVFLMIQSKGIVVEKGSVLSHTAIIGRELGIPTIVGAKDATRRIPDGAAVSIDGTTGEIQWQ
jgi:phosphohistidine swiveling domain-containing protein